MFSKLRAEIDRWEKEIEELFERKPPHEPATYDAEHAAALRVQLGPVPALNGGLTQPAAPITSASTPQEVASAQAVPGESPVVAPPVAVPNNIAYAGGWQSSRPKPATPCPALHLRGLIAHSPCKTRPTLGTR